MLSLEQRKEAIVLGRKVQKVYNWALLRLPLLVILACLVAELARVEYSRQVLFGCTVWTIGFLAGVVGMYIENILRNRVCGTCASCDHCATIRRAAAE